jgi:hypothetical protein
MYCGKKKKKKRNNKINKKYDFFLKSTTIYNRINIMAYNIDNFNKIYTIRFFLIKISILKMFI